MEWSISKIPTVPKVNPAEFWSLEVAKKKKRFPCWMQNWIALYWKERTGIVWRVMNWTYPKISYESFLVSSFDNLRGSSKTTGPNWRSSSLSYHHQHCFMDIQSLYMYWPVIISKNVSIPHTNVKPWSWVFPLIIPSFSITSTRYFLSESSVISTS